MSGRVRQTLSNAPAPYSKAESPREKDRKRSARNQTMGTRDANKAANGRPWPWGEGEEKERKKKGVEGKQEDV